MVDAVPVRDSILEFNDSLWVIGGKIFLSHQLVRPSSGCFWSDGASSFYVISDVTSSPLPLPPPRPLSNTSPLQKVNDAGDCNAAWRIGEAFLKVQSLNISSRRTREHVTLAYLHDPANKPLPTFPIPQVLHHDEFNGRYYLITSRVPGETLENAWPSMSEDDKQACVKRVVDICKELARKEHTKICGVDGNEVSDPWMKPQVPSGDSHQESLGYCKEIDMDCSVFVLHHCDMGPTNVIVDSTQGYTVGLVDWESTGFVPKEWIRTKFCVCWAMDFDFAGGDAKRSEDWRQRVQSELGSEGFSEVADAWKNRFKELQLCKGAS